MFNLYGTERLIEWKKVREAVEVEKNPYHLVADVWSRAPFVNPYLDPKNPSEWPDPWHLILDNRYDDLAIALGMLYTVKLTRRFMNTVCEIHTSMSRTENTPRFFLIVDNKYVLNYDPREVLNLESMNCQTDKIWSVSQI